MTERYELSGVAGALAKKLELKIEEFKDHFDTARYEILLGKVYDHM